MAWWPWFFKKTSFIKEIKAWCKETVFVFLQREDFTGMSLSLHDINPRHLGICRHQSTYEKHPAGYITKQLSLSKSYRTPSGQHEFSSVVVLKTDNSVQKRVSRKHKKPISSQDCLPLFDCSDLKRRLLREFAGWRLDNPDSPVRSVAPVVTCVSYFPKVISEQETDDGRSKLSSRQEPVLLSPLLFFLSSHHNKDKQ